ncbi:MAG: sialate O-acetylesterase, partial [Bacteroidota bacterium]
MKPLLHTFLVVILTVFLSGCDKQPAGYIVLSNMFGDNMVLQRQKPVVVWGKASPNKKINIELAGNMASAVASADSLWEATLPALEAGGPYDLKISGKDTVIVFENILIGDVWLCSGQSNMVWKIDWKTQPPLDTIEADNTQIRLFTVPNQYALQETWNIPESSWNVCNPKTARDFSAVAYYFGQKINKTQNVPIGLVCSAWGGTIAQTWISSDKIVDIDKYKEAIEKRDKLNLDSLRSEKQKSKDQILAKVAKTDGIINGKAVWAETDFDDSSWETMSLPGLWERRGLEGLDGVVWFRKAINIDKADLGKNAVLNLAKIDDSDKTWVNGVLVGETNAYNFERNYKIKNNILKEGKNVIAMRVKDDSLGGGIYGDTNLVNLTIGNKFIPLQG